MTTSIQKCSTAVIATGLFAVSLLIGTSMTATVEVLAVDQETINKQLDQANKAIESGDNEAAKGYLGEAVNSTQGEQKMHIEEAIKSLQSADMEGAKTHLQAANITNSP